MKTHVFLLIKALFVTAAFAALFWVATLATTLTFQAHVHPDEWRTTGYDIAAGTIVVAAYIAALARMGFNFWKCRNEKKT